MNVHSKVRVNRYHFRWGQWMAALMILVMLFSSQPLVPSAVTPALAQTSTIHLIVVGAGMPPGPVINNFQYMINIDNTGTTTQRSPDPGTGCSPQDAGYPDSCHWVSVAGAVSSSPIFTQGNQDDFNGVNGNGITLPDGRYLVSVLADGYKIDGAHFSVPLEGNGDVIVQMQPYDLPDATIQAEVFEDVAPTNSAPDVPAERGLAGFVGHIADYIDEVTTDVYGDPLCGNGHCVSQCYVVDGGVDIGTVDPVDSDGRCPIGFTTATDPLLTADITQTREGTLISSLTSPVVEGKLIIPHLGPNRYALSVIRPTGTNWAQTTTLEGNHDWDSWVMEGATGLDTEFVVAGEPFPATFFGFVKPTNTMAAGSGEIKGVALAVSAYIPPVGGITGEVGLLGAKPKAKNPIHRLFISLSDLNNNDQTVFMQEFDCNEALSCPPVSFDIPNVPDGDYVLGAWDEPQDYIFLVQNVSVRNGETVDLGSLSLLGWWTTFEGHVFNDLNENGKMDPGEPGIPNFPVVLRTRENSIMDRGATLVTTDASGYYWMENAYPLTQWIVEEAYADGFKTTGITFQADNQPEETTILGQGVDVNVHPVIGLGGRLDWGVKAYDPGTNGGIVGTISYDTTRNELDPAYAVIEDWQPSISGLKVDLFAPVDCPYDENGNPTAPCDPLGFYMLNPDGSYATGELLNQYVSETWERPKGCVARKVDGNPLINGVDEQALPLGSDTPGNDQPCLEAPMLGVQFGPMADGVGTPEENFGASVDGNYGFGDGCFGAGGFDPNTGACADGSDPTPLPSNRDYLVKVEIPTEGDVYGAAAVHPGEALYKVTREEDINIGNGDSFVPQVPPPPCAGPLHTVDVADGTDNYPEVIGQGYDVNGVPVGVTVPASTPTVNPTFVDIGGSPYEGQQKPLCDMKLVHLGDRKSIAPGFNLFTDVPLPGRFWGLLVDDLNFSSNPKSLLYGEKMGIPFAPVGIYDYTNRLIYTTESDYNGLYDVLLPSTNRISCPTPSGVCANLYRFVGNDPGVPGHWNPNYTPMYRTISAEFEAFPGLMIPADLAPTQVAVGVQIPDTQTLVPVVCSLNDPTGAAPATIPELFAVSQPYVNGSGSFTIDGQGFGGAAGQVTLDGTALPITSWTDGRIDASIPAGTSPGPHQLMVTSANGQKTVNGLTFHVIAPPTTTFGPFPSTNVLDNFNRGNGTLNSGVPGSPWGGDVLNQNTFRINNQNVQVRGSGYAWRTTPLIVGYGADQEAYFTFVDVSNAANLQGLLLKFNGLSPTGLAASWIEVAYIGSSHTVVVRTKNRLTNSIVTRGAISAAFANGDQLGARATADGRVRVYKNGTEIGNVDVSGWLPLLGATGGRIGVHFNGAGGASAADARFDDFGGGDVTGATIPGYQPAIYEVGPGRAYTTIQSALDAAAAVSGQDALVVVYPGAVDPTNPRYNGRGAYYENLIMYSPVKLQGVGPGGVRYADGSIVQGSIIDGIAFGGDTTLATNWLTKISSLTWDGSQDINDGQVIYVLASENQTSGPNQARQFGAAFKAAIDGFDIRGGDQQGLPGNLNAIFGGFPGPLQAAQVETQGGAIFANAYVRNLQITNNVIDNNGGSYGAIRIGTPNLPAPNASQHNENLRIANNRILANGGTNLAGAIGLFNGADNYEVANNDLCGNFSAEYGGAISHFGYSPNGKIHDNRIYYNHSYDEGAGIMIAGELATNPNANYGQPGGPQGSGPVDLYNNLIQSNLAEDDGGGLRFLMAGNFPMNVYNNMIVNNVSTHEGGGVALDDAPKVRFYNNTVMKNITTATAITSNGAPAPAGLSSGQNSAQLQATLPAGSPVFSSPLLFNNIFWDNRAGSRGINMVIGIGAAGDATPINNWDLGAADASGTLVSSSSIIQSGDGAGGADPGITTGYDTVLSFTSWRTNVNFIGAIMVTANLPPNLQGDYHLSSGSPAIDAGAASATVPSYQQPPASLAAPSSDIDNQARPSGSAWDIGADEWQP
jgi:hypothetical protein